VLERPVVMRARGAEWSVELHGCTSGLASKNAGGTRTSAAKPRLFRVTFPRLDEPLPVGDAERWAMYQRMCSCMLPAQQLGPCVHATAVIVEASTVLRRAAGGVSWDLVELFHPRVRACGLRNVYRAMSTVSGLHVDRSLLSVSDSTSAVMEPLWLYPDAAARAASAGWRIAAVTRPVTFSLSAIPRGLGAASAPPASDVPSAAALLGSPQDRSTSYNTSANSRVSTPGPVASLVVARLQLPVRRL
jgi:hypothetical protein